MLPWAHPSLIHASLGSPESNTYFLGLTRVQIPNSVSISSTAFAQLTAESLYSTTGHSLFPLKLPLPIGDMAPRLIHGSLGPSEPKTHTVSRLVHPFFSLLTAYHPYTLQQTTLFPLKIDASHGGSIWTPSNTIHWAPPCAQPK